MHNPLYLLILIGVLAGFFLRPLNMFVFGSVFSLVKYTQSKTQAKLLIVLSALTTASVSLSSVFLALKLPGFIPFQGNSAPTFVISFFVGGMLWVIYAKLFNHECRVDFDKE